MPPIPPPIPIVRHQHGPVRLRADRSPPSGYFQDKWQVNSRLTLNLGVRYDWQDLTKKTKDAIGPRVGVAYDLSGDGKTLVRGGFGKVYQYQQLNILQTLLQRTVIAPTFAYDTTQVTSPAITGTFPVGANANATACLNPIAGPNAGEAVISPACRAFLQTQRASVLAGGVVNNTTTGPLVDGDRRMAYTWAFSTGIKRELMKNMAVSVDYVGNRGKANTAVIDINEGPVNPATGRVTRLGVNVFDPNGELVPQARGTTFVQFNQHRRRARLGARQQVQFSGDRPREAALEPVVRPRQLHAGALQRCRLDHHRQQPAARLRPLRPRQRARVCDQRVGRHRQGVWRRHRVPRLLGLPD